MVTVRQESRQEEEARACRGDGGEGHKAVHERETKLMNRHAVMMVRWTHVLTAP